MTIRLKGPVLSSGVQRKMKLAVEARIFADIAACNRLVERVVHPLQARRKRFARALLAGAPVQSERSQRGLDGKARDIQFRELFRRHARDRDPAGFGDFERADSDETADRFAGRHGADAELGRETAHRKRPPRLKAAGDQGLL